MKHIKIITAILLTMVLCQLTTAEKRVAPRYTMEDLTNPESQSYVPYPYPKTNEEIVADLKIQLKKMYSRKSWSHSLTTYYDLLPELLKENSGVEVSEIIKVKNRISTLAHDYSYLIVITDKNRNLNARVSMSAYGLLAGGSDPSPTNNIKKTKNKVKTKKILKEKFGMAFKEETVKEFDAISYSTFGFASIGHPLYRLKLTDGTVYYMDDRDRLYTLSEKKQVRENRAAEYQQEKRKFAGKGEVVFDTLSETILFFKETRKKYK